MKWDLINNNDMAKKVTVRTTAAPFKVRVKVEPVAWRNGRVLKYRGAVVVTDSKRHSRQIGGDPAETKLKAMENLKRELATFQASTVRAISYTNLVIEFMTIGRMIELPTDEELERYIECCNQMNK